MSLDIKIDGGALRIELCDLVPHLPETCLRLLSQYAVFQETLLNGVCDALAEGVMFDDWWCGGDTFDKLRQKLIPLMPKVTAELVTNLINERDHAREMEKRWRDACWHIERGWEDARLPVRMDYVTARAMTREDAAEYIRRVEQEAT